MAPDLASRIKAKLTKRRPSLSTKTNTTASTSASTSTMGLGASQTATSSVAESSNDAGSMKSATPSTNRPQQTSTDGASSSPELPVPSMVVLTPAPNATPPANNGHHGAVTAPATAGVTAPPTGTPAGNGPNQPRPGPQTAQGTVLLDLTGEQTGNTGNTGNTTAELTDADNLNADAHSPSTIASANNNNTQPGQPGQLNQPHQSLHSIQEHSSHRSPNPSSILATAPAQSQPPLASPSPDPTGSTSLASRPDQSILASSSNSNSNSNSTTTTTTTKQTSNASITFADSPASRPSSVHERPAAPPRRKSAQASSRPSAAASSSSSSYHQRTASRDSIPSGARSTMTPPTRKIWVKRPDASATLITINQDDLVDDVRETILRKYANSLGKTFDSPDLNLRVLPRDHGRDRVLGPEEHMGRTIDSWYPGGQDIHEAIIIDIPRRTPRASPRFQQAPHTAAAIYYNMDDGSRPTEAGEGYFPPFQNMPSPGIPLNGAPPHSIAVLGTGQIPPIPSPGGTRSRHHRERTERPRLGRTHTASSGLQANGSSSVANNHGTQQLRPRMPHSRTHSTSSDPPHPGTLPLHPHQHSHAMPKSPASEHVQPLHVGTPPPRIASPRSTSARPKKTRKSGDNAHQSPGPGPLNGSVPPINVLIVEDNPINLKLLEAFMKRLKVRWKIAMNGRDAVKKWRTGGFHLVLMDIQLPVMNGLEATREIRRLERVNSIGVFSSTPTTPMEELNALTVEDSLENASLFKGPVIIVALTASSLQSDRHEALAAGCNDFLTKVSFTNGA